MRLKTQRIELLVDLIVSTLEKEEMIVVFDRHEADNIVRAVFLEDMEREAELDDQVREILQGYHEYMMREKIPFHQMFRMIKEKLAKETGIIL